MQRLVACIALCIVGTSATHVSSMLRHTEKLNGFVKAIEFKHRLRVCNAYALAGKLDVFRGKGEKLTAAPLSYKKCEDFLSPLKAGDKLDFKIADNNVGSFSVSELPNSDAVLLLIVQRHDSVSTAIAFESHVFANIPNAQIAVIDAYKGTNKDNLRITDAIKTTSKDAKAAAKAARSEDLRYDSVVAISPGSYEVSLAGQAVRTSLVALDHESYVVLRVGNEDKRGAFPEELVVFPQSDAHALPSGAATLAPIFNVVLAVLAFVVSVM